MSKGKTGVPHARVHPNSSYFKNVMDQQEIMDAETAQNVSADKNKNQQNAL